MLEVYARWSHQNLILTFSFFELQKYHLEAANLEKFFNFGCYAIHLSFKLIIKCYIFLDLKTLLVLIFTFICSSCLQFSHHNYNIHLLVGDRIKYIGASGCLEAGGRLLSSFCIILLFSIFSFHLVSFSFVFALVFFLVDVVKFLELFCLINLLG